MEERKPALTYEIVRYGPSVGIRCLLCNKTSYHPRDVEEKYCGYCHKFHEVVARSQTLAPKGEK
jgi:hypothetical protein